MKKIKTSIKLLTLWLVMLAFVGISNCSAVEEAISATFSSLDLDGAKAFGTLARPPLAQPPVQN